MKKSRLNTLFLILTVFLIILSTSSCSKGDTTPGQDGEDGVSPSEKAVFHLTFEKGNEGFSTPKDSDRTVPDIKNPLKEVAKPTILKNKDGAYHCGDFFFGKNEAFKNFKIHDFNGNNTTFLGANVSACIKGLYSAVVAKSFSLDKPLKKTATLSVNYYNSKEYLSDFESNLIYSLSVFGVSLHIYKKGEKTPYMSFRPEINDKGWSIYSKELTRELPKGDYFLLVQIRGTAGAIDDIKLTE